MHWNGEHPIADGAQKVDFVADEAYEVANLQIPLRRKSSMG